jgi:tetratricopeptide (TPR) repeat protein
VVSPAATTRGYEARQRLTEKADIFALVAVLFSEKWWYTHCSAIIFSTLLSGMGNNLRCFSRLTIVDPTPMASRAARLARAAAIVGLLVGLAQPVFADARSNAKAQVDFGIKVAQNGLWKEATYRWEKAVEIDPTYAAAWNNLGIGYEHEGRFDDARKAYEKAVALDPKNALIRQNYDLFKEINDRAKRRNDR